MATSNDSREKFRNLSSKLSHLFLERSEGDCKLINQTLDDLCSVNYRYPLVENPIKAVLLINQCCSFIPVDDSVAIPKCCGIITNLINLQKVMVQGRTSTVAIQWCLRILSNHNTSEDLILEVLKALDALLRSSNQNFLTDLLSSTGPIIRYTELNTAPEVLRYTLQCIEACTVSNEIDEDEKLQPYYNKCIGIFLQYLSNPKNLDSVSELKIILICLRGLENILNQTDEIDTNDIGQVLGIIKSYMLLGLKNVDFLQPKVLLPSNLSIPELTENGFREKKGGKIRKQKKHKLAKKEDTKKTEEWMSPSDNCEIVSTNFVSSLSNMRISSSVLITSESDFSDTEANRGANIFKLQSRIRQISLSLLYTTAKATDKSRMFSYWSSFIPENSLSGKHYLTTCFIEDTSPKCRTIALNVLLFLLSSSKPYFSQAEYSDRVTSFTSFSSTLGYMITELHCYLSLALNEKVSPVLAQVLKCYGALVQSTPYHRLKSGLLSRVVRNIRQFVRYKDPTIQVGALNVLGCILSSEPVVPETKALFLKSNNTDLGFETQDRETQLSNDEDFMYAEFSSDDETSENSQDHKTLPWILERCLKNLDVSGNNGIHQAPTPVKVESVQVISSMCRNYFDCLVYPYLMQIGKALNQCLCDKYIDLKVLTGHTIDFIGQSLEQYLSSLATNREEKVSLGLNFWQILINGSLTSLLQSEQQAPMKAVGCDCLGSIGSHIFERLPEDKQILCITLLFACSRDDESSVRGAALRALGISVLYPILREDPGFVVDTAEAIYRSLGDESLAVKIKCSWSLGNLSDALVLNSYNENLEELPNSLLLKLLERSINSCEDNDRIKMNVVRGIGNFLQLITADLMLKKRFMDTVASAINCLVRTATQGSHMKVRWNSCYAIGKVLKKEALYCERTDYLGPVFNALNELVINYRNFKVRINAALALSSPVSRKLYGIHYQTTWTSLLKALENSQSIDVYQEYQHRDNLVEQICLTIGHLITILEVDDLSSLHESLNLHYDILKCQVIRVNGILLPEKSHIFASAYSHLKTLKDSNLKNGANEALSMLKEIFAQEY